MYLQLYLREDSQERPQEGAGAILYYVRAGDVTLSEFREGTLSSSTPGPENLLPQTDNRKMNKLLYEFRDVFREDLPQRLPPNRDVDHVIETGDQAPVNRNAYPLSVQQLREQQKQVTSSLEKGLIRESTSPWGAPVLFVRKPKTNEWRMCVDYRALNARTRKYTYPLPRINECIDKLGKACKLSKFSLIVGLLARTSCGQRCSKDCVQYKIWKVWSSVMPFGLTNAPATFQTLMNQILRPYIGQVCFGIFG